MSQILSNTAVKPQKLKVFNLGNDSAYQNWRDHKLAKFPIQRNDTIVTLANMAEPQDHEIAQIVNICQKTNFAIYQLGPVGLGRAGQAILPDVLPDVLADVLESFCRHLGLQTMETHRSADKSGVVAIEQTTLGGKAGYIPYTSKPLSWHTDGYYNAPDDRIGAMVLHCVRDASEGGISELFDPEIAYIRLRDENPQFIVAFMHQEVLTIPANDDPRSDYRPDSIGPVFEVDATTGHLHMRYSARTRNIIWRDDRASDEARQFLTHILKNDPLIVRHKLKSGQGVISNNVLHNRSGFIEADNASAPRLLYRIRYKERVSAV